MLWSVYVKNFCTLASSSGRSIVEGVERIMFMAHNTTNSNFSLRTGFTGKLLYDDFVNPQWTPCLSRAGSREAKVRQARRVFSMSINKNKLIESITSRGGFTIVPNEIWSLPITHKAKLVYVFILMQAQKWEPSIRSIGSGVNYGNDAVLQAIKELQRVKMIEIMPRGPGLRNEYYLTPIEEWNFTEVYGNVEQ
jgi:hypothetical protein